MEVYLYEELTKKVIGAAITVHKTLGPGFPEKVYQKALVEEFLKQNITFSREKRVEIYYEDKLVGYEIMDFCVDNKLVIELKIGPKILDIHSKQVVSYLKAMKYRLGLILNFGTSKLEIKRVIL